MGPAGKKISVTKILNIGYFSHHLVILHLWALALVLANIINHFIPRPLTVLKKNPQDQIDLEDSKQDCLVLAEGANIIGSLVLGATHTGYLCYSLPIGHGFL
jgi:hypothetical protein